MTLYESLTLAGKIALGMETSSTEEAAMPPWAYYLGITARAIGLTIIAVPLIAGAFLAIYHSPVIAAMAFVAASTFSVVGFFAKKVWDFFAETKTTAGTTIKSSNDTNTEKTITSTPDLKTVEDTDENIIYSKYEMEPLEFDPDTEKVMEAKENLKIIEMKALQIDYVASQITRLLKTSEKRTQEIQDTVKQLFKEIKEFMQEAKAAQATVVALAKGFPPNHVDSAEMKTILDNTSVEIKKITSSKKLTDIYSSDNESPRLATARKLEAELIKMKNEIESFAFQINETTPEKQVLFLLGEINTRKTSEQKTFMEILTIFIEEDNEADTTESKPDEAIVTITQNARKMNADIKNIVTSAEENAAFVTSNTDKLKQDMQKSIEEAQHERSSPPQQNNH